MFVFGGIENTLSIPEEIFSGLIANGSIEVNVLLNIEFFGQFFKLLLMFYIFRYFGIVTSSND